MNVTEFVKKFNGTYVEVAGTTAQNQCVDLANLYIRDFLGLPIIEWTNAVDFPSKVNADDYDYILNTPNGVPQEGDLVIWGGTYGHIAIFIEGNATRFTSFDENFPIGSPCHIQEHTYLSPKVLGWLHPRKQILDLQAQLDQMRAERDDNWQIVIAIANKLNVSTNKDVILAELDKLVVLEDAVVQKDHQLSDKDQIITSIKAEAETLTKQVNDLSIANTVAQKAIAELQSKADEQNKIILRLGDRIEELKKVSPDAPTGWSMIVEGIKRLFRG